MTARRAAIVSLIAIAAAAASTCGGETAVETLVGPDGVRCQTTLGGPSAPVPPAGGAASITITAARDCTWTATSEASWMQLNATSGQGNATLGVTVARNDVPAARTGAIVVNNQRVTISQQPLVCTYELRASPQNVGAEGGRGTVSIDTQAGCPWTAVSSAPWLRVLTANGSGPAGVQFEAAANTGGPRMASVTIGAQSVTITQDAVNQPGGGSESCSITLGSSTVNAAAAGGTHTVAVVANPGCDWTATTSAALWLTVSPVVGSGNGSLTLTVLRNTGSARTATVTVGGQTVTVNQAAAPPCTFTIAAASATVPATGGERSVRVTTQDGCEWTATGGDPSWTQIATPRGTGTSDARYSVAPHNTGTSPRSTTLTIAGHSHTVNQEPPAAPTCTYTLTPGSQDFPASGGNFTFNVATQPNCSWTASNGGSQWVTITSTTANSVSYSVSQNSGAARQASISVSGGGGSASHNVTQQPQPAQTCTFSLSSSSQNVPAIGGTFNFDVNTQPNCNWQAQAGDPTWVNISSGSGSGTKTVVYSVSNNSSTSTRSTSISISGSNVSHAITQAGQAPTCTYTVQPGSQQFPASGGPGTFTVNTQSGCAWTFSGGANWITNVTQSGNSVSYTVQPNGSGAQRQASFTVSFSGGSQSHGVTQLP